MGKQSNRQDFCKFNIQLLSDKSVVLVTATGFESEIFVPQLKNNRIALTNVVCSRQPKNQRSETRLSVRPNLIRSNRITNRRLITATAGSLGLKFDIKLISNGNVVLVECNGYESEIFLPLISSRSVTMKRVSALELTRYAWQISFNENTEKGRGSAAVLAASLAAQAVGLTKLLVSPSDIVSSETSSSLIVKEKKKKNSKLLLKAAGDAKIKELAKYKSPSSAYKL
ncbi:hypothetical protein KR215_008669 [Drosophila sulfurigaster]|nr:hypothetical protein KR215_008669 [Drosophila sulfurigaster]